MYDNKELYTALKELQVIPDTQLEASLNEAQSNGILLGDVLLDKNLMSEDDLGKVLADMYKVPFVRLTNLSIPKEILTIIPEVIAKEQHIIAFKKDEKGLYVATDNPLNKAIIQFLESKLGIPLTVSYSLKKDLDQALTLYLKEIGKAFEDIIRESLEEANRKTGQESEPPIIKIVETIINYAYQNNASDIHIEPEVDAALLRFRMDGVLHDIISFSLEIFPQIVSRVKVLAKLRIDEHQEPQDGKIQYLFENKPLDIRVSIVPVKKGEKVVMRLLSERARQISLVSLGVSQKDLEKIKEGYEKPYGMILASGPTGCGKTTTLYAILKILNKRDVNIMTIEDPIEYDIEGVNQMQVNTKANLTFGNGLRSILRQDPNIILVGEIRDEETANIAVSAAMTGHLMLSSLHTNDAATALPRLFDMNIEPFIIASTVNIIIAQRLVRKIHGACRVSKNVERRSLVGLLDEEMLTKIFGMQQQIRLYEGKGCAGCHNTGYDDRTGIFEVMLMDEDIRQAIIAKKDSNALKQIARKNGMKTILEDGLEKVKIGETTIEEVLRVTTD